MVFKTEVKSNRPIEDLYKSSSLYVSEILLEPRGNMVYDQRHTT